MFIAAVILLTGMLVLSVAFAVLLRSWVLTESEKEEHLHDPRTHTIDYAIPNGVDPVVYAVAVHKAGFTSVTDRVGDAECIRVECPETERAHLRSLLESVHVPRYDASATSPGHVVFQDEC